MGRNAHNRSPDLDAFALKRVVFALLCIAAIFPQFGFAETIAPTVSTVTKYKATSSWGWSCGGSAETFCHTSAAAACADVPMPAIWSYAGTQAPNECRGNIDLDGYRGSTYLLGNYYSGPVQDFTCPAGYTLNASNMCERPDSCQMYPGDANTPSAKPAGCDCPADSQWVPMSGCRKTCNNSANIGAPTFNSVEFASGKSEACMNGCVVQATAGEYLEYRDGSRLSKATQTNWACSTNGAPGTATTPQPEATKIPDANIRRPRCAQGEGVLTTNTGGVRCLPPGTPDTRVPQITQRETVQDYPDGSSTTTITTITRDPGTGAIYTSTTTINTEKTGGGQGQAGPVGTGNTGTGGDGNGSEGDPCTKDPMRIGCQKLEAPGEEGALDGTQKGVANITVTPFASVAQCPANVPLPKGATFKWEPICDLATGVKPILIALAWLTAGLIVMGAFKE